MIEDLEEIGSGGFGVIRKVRLEGGELGALKTFRPPIYLSVDESRQLHRRFEREVQFQAELPPELFVPVLRQYLNENPPFFIMALATRNFESEIQAYRGDRSRMQRGLLNILEGMQFLEERGYVHRDIKPGNALLHDDRWKLSDFGLLMLPPSTGTRLTRTRDAYFTEEYCAPEQFGDFRNVTFAADIYSFGCILHDIYGDGSPRLPPGARLSCSGPMGIVVERCTELDPLKRFKSVASLRSALMDVLDSVPLQANPEVANLIGAIHSGDTLDSLRGYLHAHGPGDERELLRALDEEALTSLHGSDAQLWDIVVERYVSWCAGGSFDFDYCDVLIGRLQRIFDLGSDRQKASAAVAAAILAATHKRYFVMHRVIAMCGINLSSTIARHVAIELEIARANDYFRQCAIHTDQEPARVYHPIIAARLDAAQ